ncbi:lysophospholipase [Bacillus sp. NP157]|nr:lysophospholipase [Bacillus sp. NP157]
MVELVMIPGMDGTGRLFDPLRAALPAGFRTHVIPYAEHGACSYAELAQRMRASLPTTPYVLLGESFGGPLAILLAAQRPAGMRGLVLAATFAACPRPWARHARGLLPLVRMNGLFARWSAPWLIGRRADPALREAYRDSVSRLDNATLRARLDALLAVDETAALRSVDVPLLCLRASRDLLVPPGAEAALRTARPDGLFETVAGPHGILQANPAMCARHITRFVAGLEPA